MLISLSVTLILFVVSILIPIAAGIYVYRDAKQRQMNALLWTVIAVFVPGLIGFVIYLLVRGNYSDLRCPNCQAVVKKEFAVCPNCGTKLRPSCPNCSAPVEPEWKVCPFCAEPLPEQSVTAPVHAKDRPVGKIIAVVMIVPLALITLFLASSMVFSGGGGTCGMTETTRNAYFAEQTSEEIRQYVQEWLANLDEQVDEAHALQYSETDQNDRTKHDILLYVPGAGNGNSGIGMTSSIFGTTLHLNFEATGDSGTLYSLTTTTDHSKLKLKVLLDDEKIPCSVTEVDFPPSLMYSNSEGQDNIVLPQRITVTKLQRGERTEDASPVMTKGGTLEILDQSMIEKLFAAIDDAHYLDVDDPIYDSLQRNAAEAYHIALEYQVNDVLNVAENMDEVIVWAYNGACYLEDLIYNEDGRYLRQADSGLYELLSELQF